MKPLSVTVYRKMHARTYTRNLPKRQVKEKRVTSSDPRYKEYKEDLDNLTEFERRIS